MAVPGAVARRAAARSPSARPGTSRRWRSGSAPDGRDEEAGIFDAQALMVDGPDADRGLHAAHRPKGRLRRPRSAMPPMPPRARSRRLDDDLLAGRAADVRDVGARLARLVAGDRARVARVPSIAVADDLPAVGHRGDRPGPAPGHRARGGVAHRARGDPRAQPRHPRGDGRRGAARRGRTEWPARRQWRSTGRPARSFVEPTPDDRGASRLDRRRADATRACSPAPAASGRGADRRSSPTANGSACWPTGRPSATRHERSRRGAEGIGLYRTEFLFMGRYAPPTESEQAAAYRSAFEAFGPRAPGRDPAG